MTVTPCVPEPLPLNTIYWGNNIPWKATVAA